MYVRMPLRRLNMLHICVRLSLLGARRTPALRAQYGGPPAGPGRVGLLRVWQSEGRLVGYAVGKACYSLSRLSSLEKGSGVGHGVRVTADPPRPKIAQEGPKTGPEGPKRRP